MKFGKEIQSQQIPGWSQHYLDYKALKKIISAANKGALENPSPSLEAIRPSDLIGSKAPSGSLPATPSVLPSDSALSGEVNEPLAIPTVGRDEDRGPEYQRSKTMFFFKLGRELDKINTFYLQKEGDLKLRLDTLLSKRRAAKQRSAANIDGSLEVDGVEWRAVQEGFRSLDKDLSKLKQFIDLNATGFRKILKKWDKRSKSRTKELYLARQVEVQPCFNRELIGHLSDTVAACLLDPENGGSDLTSEVVPSETIVQQQLAVETNHDQRHHFRDFENNLMQLAMADNQPAVTELLQFADTSLARNEADRPRIMRILWRVGLAAPVAITDLILASAPFDLEFVDDINGRTSLHEAALAGELRLVDLCLERGIQVNRQDVYGRSAIYYACINGHYAVAQRLLAADANPSLVDMDNHTPLIYAIVNGHMPCVRTLVDIGHAGVAAPEGSTNLFPLSLACQHGHLDIVVFLLERGAAIVPNTNGEFPIHLAAREGHTSICRLLVSQPNGGNKDTPDKYNEWTPLFHAARHGFDECVQVLLDAAVNPHATDEHGKTAAYYASWYGQVKCTNQLIQAMATQPARVPLPKSLTATRALAASLSSQSPTSEPNISPYDGSSLGPTNDTDMDLDLDMIPSLSLPPPIMPFRIYGHNYLDQMYLLQITLGPNSCPGADSSPVELLESFTRHPDFTRRTSDSKTSPSLKIVMTLRPNSADMDAGLITTHSTTLPLPEQGELFSFQTRTLDDITLEFSFYPSFGSRAIGRAVASPQTLLDNRPQSGRAIPILDHRLHVIGKISFEALVITPFSEVALEIGGAVETYWKSTAVPSLDVLSSQQQQGSSALSSSRSTALTSPDLRSPSFSANAAAANIVTLSSLSGEFVHIVVQVTRDGVPVVFPDWNVPVENNMFDLGIADLSAAQFEQLSQKVGRKLLAGPNSMPTSAAGWHRHLSQKMTTLREVLEVLPVSYGVSLELRYPNPVIRERYHLGHHHQPNAYVDAVLKAVYSVSQALPHEAPRRKIVFSSYVPAICTTINWKQPNYAVFFASKCGVARGSGGLLPPGQSLPADEEESDPRCRSVGAAVQFAKSNNLLGVIVNASLISVIPSLVQGIKEHGVILAAFGTSHQLNKLNSIFNNVSADAPKIDATLNDGVLSYIDHVLSQS